MTISSAISKSLLADHSQFIGIDLGGTQLRAACLDKDGTILGQKRLPTDTENGPDGVLAQISALIAEVRTNDCRGIGIGIPGTFSALNGTVLNIPALDGWKNYPLAQHLQKEIVLPVWLENDAKVAAIGEGKIGAARDCRNFVYATISTGIGGGVFVDGNLLRGAQGLAGEIGHTRIADASAVCSCGKTGCWESVASGTALAKKMTAAIAANPNGILASLVSDRPPSGRDLPAAIAMGDEDAIRILAEEAFFLGAGFVNLQHFYAPERIVMGGGVSALLPLLHDDIKAVMKDRLLPGFNLAEVVRATLEDAAGVVGAAFFARAMAEAGQLSHGR
ncbi:ROK family protein [Acidisoma cellulosilyticum]|nr:ROK family protein [Acidisoma cellulosilyticum]